MAANEFSDFYLQDNSTNNITDDSDLEHKVDGNPYSILFLFASFALGAFVRCLHKRIRLPYTVVLLVCGALFGIASARIPYLQKYTALARIDPHTILHVFLPVLIFESAFAMDAHTFIKSFLQCLLLAVPGLLISSALTAVLSINLFYSYHWNWPTALLFGSILSATDPVAVVALLKELGTSKSISTVIEGESLLNDGSAIVAYTILLDLLVPGNTVSAVGILQKFCQIALGGAALGFAVGKLSVFCLSHIFNDAVVEITVTLSAAYITYYLAEVILHISGVLALVTLGTIMSAQKASISPEVEGFVHRFWEMLSYFANTVIFIVVGVVITERAYGYIQNEDWFLIFVTYIGITVFRLLMIAVLSPILSRLGYGLRWQEAVIMTWGGLRGAVSLALALSLTHETNLTDDFGGNKILIHVAGIVTLTLLINATTIKPFMKLLGLSTLSNQKKHNMSVAVKHLCEIREGALHAQMNDQLLTDADWKWVESFTEIPDPYRNSRKNNELNEEESPVDLGPLRQSVCPNCNSQHNVEPTLNELIIMKEEARLSMITVQKMSYWRQYEHGVLTRDNIQLLIGAADAAADKHGMFTSINDLQMYWKIHEILTWLKKILEKVKIKNISLELTQEDGNHKSACRILISKVVLHPLFHITVTLVVVVNIALIIVEIVSYLDELQNSHGTARSTSFYINLGFIFFYVTEALIKILASGWKKYWLSHMNKMEFLLLILQIIDIVMDIILFSAALVHIETSITYLILSRVIRLLRALRLLKTCQFLALGLLLYVSGLINAQLYAGYDIACGFLSGEEEVLKIVDEISPYLDVAQQLRRVCEKNRLQVMKELTRLQLEHPSIAVAVKSRHASRLILNSIRQELNDLKEAGLLDDSVFNSMITLIEKRMKKLLNSPKSMLPAPPLELLKNIDWISGSDDIFNYLKCHAKVVKFPKDWIIAVEGDPPFGVYIITVGLVKIKGTIRIESDGILPNSDLFDWSLRQGHVEDCVSVGSIIGELGVLTRKSQNNNISCETEVQAFHITQHDMEEAVQKFRNQPSLEYKLWRSVALKIAKNILKIHSKFEDWPINSLMMYLSQACLPDLRKSETFDIGQNIEEIVLIQGIATDLHTGQEYKGAIYIPETVPSLHFKNSEDRPVILVIGTNEYILPRNLEWAEARQKKFSNVNPNFQPKGRRRRISKPYFGRSISVWSAPNVTALLEAQGQNSTSRGRSGSLMLDIRDNSPCNGSAVNQIAYDNPFHVVDDQNSSDVRNLSRFHSIPEEIHPTRNTISIRANHDEVNQAMELHTMPK